MHQSFPLGKFRATKGAVKLHLLLDHDGLLPHFALITEGKKADVKVARTLRFPAGSMLVFDPGYNDYDEDNKNFFRRVVWWDKKRQREFVYLTNHLTWTLPPSPPCTGLAGK